MRIEKGDTQRENIAFPPPRPPPVTFARSSFFCALIARLPPLLINNNPPLFLVHGYSTWHVNCAGFHRDQDITTLSLETVLFRSTPEEKLHASRPHEIALCVARILDARREAIDTLRDVKVSISARQYNARNLLICNNTFVFTLSQ